MICDDCLNWVNCKKEEHEDRPIQELEDGHAWCGRRMTYQQVKAKWNLEYLLLKDKFIGKFLKKVNGKWEYLTNHMYEMHHEPDFEKETEKVFKELIEYLEEMLK